MDKLNQYRESIKQVLTDYDNFARQSANKKSETCLIFDETHEHYLWMSIDWVNNKRINNTHAHIRIKTIKFILRNDWTEEGIANELTHLGIPNHEIVLAFQSPDVRQFTEFALN